MTEKEERGDFTRRKTKLALLAATILVVATLLFTPIIPVKAEIAHGQTVMNPQYQKILSYGNFSVAFDLQNFACNFTDTSHNAFYVTAQHFNVVSNTETISNNQTTIHLNLQLTNVNAQINGMNLSIGSATLNVDVAMQGQYVSYAFYANTVTSVAQLIQNVLNNI